MALDQSQQATRKAPDYDDIVGVIQLYFDGFDDKGSVEKFHRVLPQGRMDPVHRQRGRFARVADRRLLLGTGRGR
jgi:hypothetical protein